MKDKQRKNNTSLKSKADVTQKLINNKTTYISSEYLNSESQVSYIDKAHEL